MKTSTTGLRLIKVGKTHLQGSLTLQLTFCLDGFDLTKQVNLLLFKISKATESKQVKQEVSCTVILLLYVSFLLVIFLHFRHKMLL